jgi:PHD/YefM family antitoxin component YafN of YafNO toxin-antitoxin module
MVTYATNELIPSSEFAKKFGTYLSLIKNSTVTKLAILKNNKVEAVLISKEEYEAMQEALKKVEAQELLEGVRKGLEDVKQGRVQPIERLWDALDD